MALPRCDLLRQFKSVRCRWHVIFLFAALGALAGEPDRPPKSAFLSQPLELRLGPVNFYPRIAAGSVYNDNILFSSVNPKRDVIWSLQPAFLAVAGDRLAVAEYRDRRLDYFEYLELGVQSPGLTPAALVLQDPNTWPGPLAMLDCAPQFNWFTQYPENNSIDQDVNLNAVWPMSALVLGVSQGYKLENTTSIEAGQRLNQETIPTALTAAYRFSEPTSVEFNLRRQSLAYPESKTLLGYNKWSNDSWLNYQVASQLSASAGVDWGLYEVSGGQNQTYERFQLRARYLFAERLSFYASAGGEARQFQNRHAATLNPVFALAAYYQPFERTTLYLNGLREENSSAYSGYNYSQTGVALGGRQQFSERFTLNAALGYYKLEYLPVGSQALPDRKDDYLLAQLNLAIRITTRLEGKLFYQYQTVTSDQTLGFANNQVGFRLNWAF